MDMDRAFEAELLDSLPATDPEALRSRRELRLINALMGNERWFRRQLERWVQPGEAVLEIGAGEGHLRKTAGNGFDYAGLDRMPKPADWPAGASWHQVDVRDFRDWSGYEVICGNLFFHHLSATELYALGQKVRKSARVILASEPAREPQWQRLFGMLCPLLGVGEVTRHDGQVSIASGFKCDELPHWLGLHFGTGWWGEVQLTRTGAYRMVAVRP